MTRTVAFFACLLAALTVSPLDAAKPTYTLTGKVVAITDGDILKVVDDDENQHRIRLAAIDAPEKKQAFGNKARQALADKVFGKVVRVDVIDTDRYKREVGRMYVGDRFVNMEMVHDGFAWRCPQYDQAKEFSAAEGDARLHRRGLWVDKHPVPPWEFSRATRNVPRPLVPLPN
jgi:endonuclease YncB( thermonuclease family)